jgi:hypothetical protein
VPASRSTDCVGRVLAARRPIHGADKVARFLLSISTEERVGKFLKALTTEPLPDQLLARIALVNGGPGIVVTYEGTPITSIVLDVADGVVQTINLVANPDKLSGISESETY